LIQEIKFGVPESMIACEGKNWNGLSLIMHKGIVLGWKKKKHIWIPNNYEEEKSNESNNMDIKSQAEKKEVRKNWTTRREIAAVRGNKITVNSVAITIGMLTNRTKRYQEKLVKFTKRKKFRIKFKEFRKKV
jgi:hypothetical protein